MELVERDTFQICGWAVETTVENNDRDISALYDGFSTSSKDALLLGLPGGRAGFFGLSWYTEKHEKYCYLLGMEVGADAEPPAGAQMKVLTATRFAVASYHSSKNIMDAWNEFFYTDIPVAGLTPNANYNLYFEYYPGDVHGDYQLWVPVVPAHC